MHKDSMTICKSCFYVKRGSLGNMQLHDLIAHLNDNADFADKCLNLHFGIFWPTSRQNQWELSGVGIGPVELSLWAIKESAKVTYLKGIETLIGRLIGYIILLN